MIVVQENRSFDNLFGGPQGFPGAETAAFGRTSTGQILPLTPADLRVPIDIQHDFNQAVTDIDYPKGSAMDGFDLEQCDTPNRSCVTPAYSSGLQYTYVPYDISKPYWNLAQSYALADHFFASDLDASFEGHEFLISGWAEQTYGLPAAANPTWGCDAQPNPGAVVRVLDPSTMPGTPTNTTHFPCFGTRYGWPDNDPTIGDELDAKRLSWRYYAPPYTDPITQPNQIGYIWSAYSAVDHIYNGPDWARSVACCSPETKFLSDVVSGNLANVTWIAPDLTNSDHDGCVGSGCGWGPSWVTSIVDAIGTNPTYWKSTAIFVLWDDWGGFYDHVPPPLLDYDGLGIRVPLIAISAYTPPGVVDKTPYEFGSVLKYVESTFGLAPLRASDTRAAAFGTGIVDPRRAPRAFNAFAAPRSRAYFIHHAPSMQIPDRE
ncbi:MAG: alkaline phosphatase family protein [Candidatus Baltobacteraceae bacterium]